MTLLILRKNIAIRFHCLTVLRIIINLQYIFYILKIKYKFPPKMISAKAHITDK